MTTNDVSWSEKRQKFRRTPKEKPAKHAENQGLRVCAFIVVGLFPQFVEIRVLRVKTFLLKRFRRLAFPPPPQNPNVFR